MSVESEFNSEMLDFQWRERFSKYVGHHVFCRTINEPDFSFFDDPTNEMKPNIDMLGPCVELMLLRERYSGLIIRKEGGHWEGDAEELGNEGPE